MLDEAIRKKQLELEEAAKVIEAQTQVLEAQRVADIRRERQFAEYAEVVEKLKHRGDETQQQVTGFIQYARGSAARVQADVPEVGARLEVRINEFAEIQRDGEDRAKRVADEFREAIQKEIRSFMVAQDEKSHPRDKRIADYEPRIEAIENESRRASSRSSCRSMIYSKPSPKPTPAQAASGWPKAAPCSTKPASTCPPKPNSPAAKSANAKPNKPSDRADLNTNGIDAHDDGIEDGADAEQR